MKRSGTPTTKTTSTSLKATKQSHGRSERSTAPAEGQDRSMDRVAQAASRIHARRVGSLAGGDFLHGRTWYPADAVRDGQRLADYGYVVLLPRTEVLIDR
jgi:hypothetical protein